jgi:hypothetical protein
MGMTAPAGSMQHGIAILGSSPGKVKRCLSRGQNWHGVATVPALADREAAMTRDDVTRKIRSAKRLKGLSWKTICAEIGGGSLPALPPSDPLIYRFYELVNVYGNLGGADPG